MMSAKAARTSSRAGSPSGEGETRVAVVGDGRERLVHLVRDGGGHLAERRVPRDVRELRLGGPQGLLRPLAIGDVAVDLHCGERHAAFVALH
jgi:hypothetical protein